VSTWRSAKVDRAMLRINPERLRGHCKQLRFESNIEQGTARSTSIPHDREHEHKVSSDLNVGR